MRRYVQSGASTSGGAAADEIGRLAELHEKGVITDAEFEQGKAKALS
jgi:Short C-terminal domain